MSCISLPFLEALIVDLIVICALVACIRILVPMLVSFTGWPWLGQLIMIILYAIIAIIIVYIVFALLACLLSAGGGLHMFPPR